MRRNRVNLSRLERENRLFGVPRPVEQWFERLRKQAGLWNTPVVELLIDLGLLTEHDLWETDERRLIQVMRKTLREERAEEKKEKAA